MAEYNYLHTNLLKQQIQNTFYSAVTALYGIEVLTSQHNVAVDEPRDKSHGDLSTSIAMQLAKKLGRNPLEIGNEIAAYIGAENLSIVDSVTVVAPGFINLTLKPAVYLNSIGDILEAGDAYGGLSVGAGKTVMMEFAQPNTHKAFHVGHLKSAITGLGLVKLFEGMGYRVIKANFFGDIGMHVAKTTWGYLHRQDTANLAELDVHERMKHIDQYYVAASLEFKEDPVVEAEIREINKKIYSQTPGPEWEAYLVLREYSIQHQTAIWKSLGIEFDREYPESEIIDEAISIVQKYQGSLFEFSEGAWVYKGEKIGLTNWVFITNEGNPTYEAKDLALAYKKFQEYNPDQSYIATSVEQIARFKVIIHLLEEIDQQFQGRYHHLGFGWMLRGGKKFSSRMGESVKGMDILSETQGKALEKVQELERYDPGEEEEIANQVANAALKFLILSHEFHKDFSYDLDQFINFEGFSGPYILYAYARAQSILRKLNEVSTVTNRDTNIELLNHPAEVALAKKLTTLAEAVYAAGTNITPHLLTNYVYEVAQLFNTFYAECPVVAAESLELQGARAALAAASAQVLKNGLRFLGIDTVERM